MTQELKPIDDTNTTIDEDNDNWETPSELYNHLCKTYQIFPKLDIAADQINRKCLDYISKQENALYTEWTLRGKVVSVWGNAPGSIQLEFLERAELQHRKYGMEIMMIFPTRVMGSIIWDKYIEDEHNRKREYHKILGRPSFLKNGRKVKNAAMHAYVVVIWKK